MNLHGTAAILRWEDSQWQHYGSGKQWDLYLGNNILYTSVDEDYTDSVMDQAVSALARLIQKEAGWLGDDD